MTAATWHAPRSMVETFVRNRPGTVGMPFPGQKARVVSVESREPLPVGEIEVRGPHVFAGYWNLPDATEASLDEDGYFTATRNRVR